MVEAEILIPSQAQNQLVVRRRNRIALPRPSDHCVHHRQGNMARRFLGEHRSLGPLLAPRNRPDGRDNLQSQPITRSATGAQVASAQTHRR